MHYLYYCNSSYQLINVLSIHWNRTFDDAGDYSADLLILNAYNGADEIVEILRKEKVFNRVELIDRVKIKGKLHTLKTIKDIVFPKAFIKNGYGYSKEFFENKYDVIYSPKFNRIVAAIWQINKNAKLHMFEDGVESYIGEYGKSKLPKSYKLIYKYLNHGRSFDNYEYLFLNKPELYSNSQKDKVRKIPSFTKENVDRMLRLFRNFSIVEKSKKQIYWMSQIVKSDESKKSINNMLEELSTYKNMTLYCPHPRNKVDNIYCYDECIKNQIWELKILNMNNIDNICLISPYSTACLTPNILYGMEPYVILTYNMISDSDITSKKNFRSLVEKMKENYKDKNKIMVPMNIDEYRKCLEIYNKSVKNNGQ